MTTTDGSQRSSMDRGSCMSRLSSTILSLALEGKYQAQFNTEATAHISKTLQALQDSNKQLFQRLSRAAELVSVKDTSSRSSSPTRRQNRYKQTAEKELKCFAKHLGLSVSTRGSGSFGIPSQHELTINALPQEVCDQWVVYTQCLQVVDKLMQASLSRLGFNDSAVSNWVSFRFQLADELYKQQCQHADFVIAPYASSNPETIAAYKNSFDALRCALEFTYDAQGGFKVDSADEKIAGWIKSCLVREKHRSTRARLADASNQTFQTLFLRNDRASLAKFKLTDAEFSLLLRDKLINPDGVIGFAPLQIVAIGNKLHQIKGDAPRSVYVILGLNEVQQQAEFDSDKEKFNLQPVEHWAGVHVRPGTQKKLEADYVDTLNPDAVNLVEVTKVLRRALDYHQEASGTSKAVSAYPFLGVESHHIIRCGRTGEQKGDWECGYLALQRALRALNIDHPIAKAHNEVHLRNIIMLTLAKKIRRANAAEFIKLGFSASDVKKINDGEYRLSEAAIINRLKQHGVDVTKTKNLQIVVNPANSAPKFLVTKIYTAGQYNTVRGVYFHSLEKETVEEAIDENSANASEPAVEAAGVDDDDEAQPQAVVENKQLQAAKKPHQLSDQAALDRIVGMMNTVTNDTVNAAIKDRDTKHAWLTHKEQFRKLTGCFYNWSANDTTRHFILNDMLRGDAVYKRIVLGIWQQTLAYANRKSKKYPAGSSSKRRKQIDSILEKCSAAFVGGQQNLDELQALLVNFSADSYMCHDNGGETVNNEWGRFRDSELRDVVKIGAAMLQRQRSYELWRAINAVESLEQKRKNFLVSGSEAGLYGSDRIGPVSLLLDAIETAQFAAIDRRKVFKKIPASKQVTNKTVAQHYAASQLRFATVRAYEESPRQKKLKAREGAIRFFLLCLDQNDFIQSDNFTDDTLKSLQNANGIKLLLFYIEKALNEKDGFENLKTNGSLAAFGTWLFSKKTKAPKSIKQRFDALLQKQTLAVVMQDSEKLVKFLSHDESWRPIIEINGIGYPRQVGKDSSEEEIEIVSDSFGGLLANLVKKPSGIQRSKESIAGIVKILSSTEIGFIISGEYRPHIQPLLAIHFAYLLRENDGQYKAFSKQSPVLTYNGREYKFETIFEHYFEYIISDHAEAEHKHNGEGAASLDVLKRVHTIFSAAPFNVKIDGKWSGHRNKFYSNYVLRALSEGKLDHLTNFNSSSNQFSGIVQGIIKFCNDESHYKNKSLDNLGKTLQGIQALLSDGLVDSADQSNLKNALEEFVKFYINKLLSENVVGFTALFADNKLGVLISFNVQGQEGEDDQQEIKTNIDYSAGLLLYLDELLKVPLGSLSAESVQTLFRELNGISQSNGNFKLSKKAERRLSNLMISYCYTIFLRCHQSDKSEEICKKFFGEDLDQILVLENGDKKFYIFEALVRYASLVNKMKFSLVKVFKTLLEAHKGKKNVNIAVLTELALKKFLKLYVRAALKDDLGIKELVELYKDDASEAFFTFDEKHKLTKQDVFDAILTAFDNNDPQYDNARHTALLTARGFKKYVKSKTDFTDTQAALLIEHAGDDIAKHVRNTFAEDQVRLNRIMAPLICKVLIALMSDPQNFRNNDVVENNLVAMLNRFGLISDDNKLKADSLGDVLNCLDDELKVKLKAAHKTFVRAESDQFTEKFVSAIMAGGDIGQSVNIVVQGRFSTNAEQLYNVLLVEFPNNKKQAKKEGETPVLPQFSGASEQIKRAFDNFVGALNRANHGTGSNSSSTLKKMLLASLDQLLLCYFDLDSNQLALVVYGTTQQAKQQLADRYKSFSNPTPLFSALYEAILSHALKGKTPDNWPQLFQAYEKIYKPLLVLHIKTLLYCTDIKQDEVSSKVVNEGFNSDNVEAELEAYIARSANGSADAGLKKLEEEARGHAEKLLGHVQAHNRVRRVIAALQVEGDFYKAEKWQATDGGKSENRALLDSARDDFLNPTELSEQDKADVKGAVEKSLAGLLKSRKLESDKSDDQDEIESGIRAVAAVTAAGNLLKMLGQRVNAWVSSVNEWTAKNNEKYKALKKCKTAAEYKNCLSILIEHDKNLFTPEQLEELQRLYAFAEAAVNIKEQDDVEQRIQLIDHLVRSGKKCAIRDAKLELVALLKLSQEANFSGFVMWLRGELGRDFSDSTYNKLLTIYESDIIDDMAKVDKSINAAELKQELYSALLKYQVENIYTLLGNDNLDELEKQTFPMPKSGLQASYKGASSRLPDVSRNFPAWKSDLVNNLRLLKAEAADSSENQTPAEIVKAINFKLKNCKLKNEAEGLLRSVAKQITELRFKPDVERKDVIKFFQSAFAAPVAFFGLKNEEDDPLNSEAYKAKNLPIVLGANHKIPADDKQALAGEIKAENLSSCQDEINAVLMVLKNIIIFNSQFQSASSLSDYYKCCKEIDHYVKAIQEKNNSRVNAFIEPLSGQLFTLISEFGMDIEILFDQIPKNLKDLPSPPKPVANLVNSIEDLALAFKVEQCPAELLGAFDKAVKLVFINFNDKNAVDFRSQSLISYRNQLNQFIDGHVDLPLAQRAAKIRAGKLVNATVVVPSASDEVSSVVDLGDEFGNTDLSSGASSGANSDCESSDLPTVADDGASSIVVGAGGTDDRVTLFARSAVEAAAAVVAGSASPAMVAAMAGSGKAKR